MAGWSLTPPRVKAKVGLWRGKLTDLQRGSSCVANSHSRLPERTPGDSAGERIGQPSDEALPLREQVQVERRGLLHHGDDGLSRGKSSLVHRLDVAPAGLARLDPPG